MTRAPRGRQRRGHTLRLLLALALTAAVAGCAIDDEWAPVGSLEQPLIGGAIATGDPAVVALQFPTADDAFCTGTLVSPSVVLTAAHCVDMFGGDPNLSVFFGTDVRGAGKSVGIKNKLQHPGWTGDVGANDIAVIQLTSPQDPTLPIPLNTTALSSGSAGTPYRHVGFGVYNRETGDSDGKKRQGTTTILGVLGGDVVTSGDSALSVCFGDSGGPGLIEVDGVEYVAGVHSYTSGEECNPPNGDTRVDVHVDDFIRPWIDANDPVCGEDGTCAKIGCSSDPDCMPCGADGTCATGCALPDPDCPTSGVGEICRADTQCETGTCITWEGDLDYHFCTLSCDDDSACPDGMSCESIASHGKVCYPDQAPPGVLGDTCDVNTDCGTYLCDLGVCTKVCDLPKGLTCPIDFTCEASADRYVCVPPVIEEGGCGCSTSSENSLGGIALLLAVGLLLGRRHLLLGRRA